MYTIFSFLTPDNFKPVFTLILVVLFGLIINDYSNEKMKEYDKMDPK